MFAPVAADFVARHYAKEGVIPFEMTLYNFVLLSCYQDGNGNFAAKNSTAFFI